LTAQPVLESEERDGRREERVGGQKRDLSANTDAMFAPSFLNFNALFQALMKHCGL
jgi:hypothetical protein